MKNLVLLLVMVVTPLIIFGQTERWLYRYNGPGNDYDVTEQIINGADENLYAVGYSIGSGTHRDFFISSLDTVGTERWIYRYNGPVNYWDQGFAIDWGLDGNIYATGSSCRNGANLDFTVLSLTSEGTERWVFQYNGPGNDLDQARAIIYGLDGNIYAAGISTGYGSHYDFVVISLTADGAPRWNYRYSGPGYGDDRAYSLVYGSDGNIYVTGFSTMSGEDVIVMSLDTAGTMRWIYRYNGPANLNDEAFSVIYGPDGNIYIAGCSQGINTGMDLMVFSITANGTERWVYRYNGLGSGDYQSDQAQSIVYGSDGNLYVAGWSAAVNGYKDFVVISLTPDGDEQWGL